MTWTETDLVEVGYAIPSLFVTPPLHLEQLTTPKQQVYSLVVIGTERDRYSEDELLSFYGTGYNESLTGSLVYNNQVSIGVTGGNSNKLDYQLDLLPTNTDAEWVTIKEPLRVVANQVQLVIFNDGDQFAKVQGYEIVIGNVGMSRIETEG